MNRKKKQHAVNFLMIFLFLFTLVMGPAASSWSVYAQSNETHSQPQSVIQSIPKTSSEENNENAGEQLISESASGGNDSGTTENQTIAGEPNTSNGFPNSQPDGDCLFDPSLPKCAPDENGNCPEGFHMNGDEQCFPAHDRCPSGYHSHEDDESGRCIPDNVPCDSGYIMSPDFPTCEYKDSVCQKHPDLKDCKEDNITSNIAYDSGYDHGCLDAKISDTSMRYINQPGKGPNYHTPEFMSGYNDGFEICSKGSDQQPPSSNSKRTFKIVVEVTNHSPLDTYGGITVSVDHHPKKVFKSAYNIYFPAGQTVLKTFTFNSSDVPVETEFEVNLDYGDDYNQYTFGKNTPVKKPEIVQFSIS